MPLPPQFGGGNRCADDNVESWPLGPADMISFVGCSPPPVLYFSFDTTLSARLDSDDGIPYYPGQPFGDTISTMNINAQSDGDDSIFNKPVVVMTTADGGTSDRFKSFYQKNGVSDSQISVREIDSNEIRLWDRSGGKTWDDVKPDLLNEIYRVSVVEPGFEQQYDMYKTQFWPVRYYKASDDLKPTQPLSPPLKPRESSLNVNEYERFSDSLEDLSTAVITDMANKGFKYIGEIPLNYTSYGCYDDWDTVIAEHNSSTFIQNTRDAVYGIPIYDVTNFRAWSYVKGRAHVMVGVNHKLVNPYAYNSAGLSIADSSTNNNSPTSIESYWYSDTEMAGSAHYYLPNDPLAASLFAMQYFPRGKCDPSSKFCTEWTKADLVEKDDDKYVMSGERVYANSNTGTGPDASGSIPFRTFVFQLNEE